MLLQLLPTSTRLSREPSTMQRTRPHCSSDHQSSPSVSERLNWVSLCKQRQSLRVVVALSGHFPCSVYLRRRLAIYTPSAARTCIRALPSEGGCIGSYSPGMVL